MVYYNEFLTNLKNGTVLIIDTCFALHDRFAEFLNALESVDSPNYKPVVPIDVYLETSKLSVIGRSEETRERATEALTLMHRGFTNNTLQLIKEFGAGSFFADASIIGMSISLSTSSDVIVCTQDCGLSRDIRSISKSEAVSGGVIDVYKLAQRGGGLYCFTDLSQKDSSDTQLTKVQFYIKAGTVEHIEYLKEA